MKLINKYIHIITDLHKTISNLLLKEQNVVDKRTKFQCLQSVCNQK